MMEYANNDLTQLGFMELISADLVSHYAGESHGAGVFASIPMYIMSI